MQLSEVPLVVWVFAAVAFVTFFGRRLLVAINGAVLFTDLYAYFGRAEHWPPIFVGGQNRAPAGVPHNAGEEPAGQNTDHHPLVVWLMTLARVGTCVFRFMIVFFAAVALIDMHFGSEHLPTLANFTVIPLLHLVDSRRNLAIERSEHSMLSGNISVTVLQRIHELQGKTNQAEFLLYLEEFKVLKNNYTTPRVLSRVIPELKSQKTTLFNEARESDQKLINLTKAYKNLSEVKETLDSQVSDLKANQTKILRLLTNCKKASKQIEEERAPSKCLIA